MPKAKTNPWQQAWDDGDIILILLAIISLIITEFASCLTTPGSKKPIHAPGKSDVHSTVTTSTKSGKAKSQARSQSTKPIGVTADPKKVAGGTTKAGPSKRSASSPRSKRSGTTSSTQTSTKSGTSQTLGFQRREQTMTSTSRTTSRSTILNTDLSTADANS